MSVEYYEFGIVENTDFIFQSAEVDARLTAHRSIHHGKQRGGDVDEVDASFECGSSESTEVGNHSASEIDHTGMAGGFHALQFTPYVADRFERLVCVVGLDGYQVSLAQAKKILDERPAFFSSGFINEYEKFVVLAFRDGHS